MLGQLGYLFPTCSSERGGVCVEEIDGFFWLDEVSCQENETSLLNCRHDNFGVHDCEPKEAVTVVCYSK